MTGERPAKVLIVDDDALMRAALLGGTLAAGARDGRFEVRARLPLAGRG